MFDLAVRVEPPLPHPLQQGFGFGNELLLLFDILTGRGDAFQIRLQLSLVFRAPVITLAHSAEDVCYVIVGSLCCSNFGLSIFEQLVSYHQVSFKHVNAAIQELSVLSQRRAIGLLRFQFAFRMYLAVIGRSNRHCGFGDWNIRISFVLGSRSRFCRQFRIGLCCANCSLACGIFGDVGISAFQTTKRLVF
ncbi:hypothetical protein [Anatilimnocola floriformis]|uniref:hypothetical protein n=1 Tax=Anatilimnocola floriformis TaxID=2948575 RepID=UPI0020C2D27D|nr:hypothetical protein [Anatilimnocola floriformis]